MDADVQQWISQFRADWEDKPITYLDEHGEWAEDDDPLFPAISSAIQSREYELSVEELLEISHWKLQGGRNDHNITQNTSAEVTQQLQTALEADTDAEAVDALTECSGIGIPMASTVLTVTKPAEYAIIDYRAFRGLVGVRPDIFDPSEYGEYASFLEHFRNYTESPAAYEFYMGHVRDIAASEGVSAREVDMALWALDRSLA